MSDDPTPPVNVRFWYAAGSAVSAASLHYLGWYPERLGDEPMHHWQAVIPDPSRPGLSEVTIGMLPPKTVVHCETTLLAAPPTVRLT